MSRKVVEMAETQVESSGQEALSLAAIYSGCDKLNVEELKRVIGYCSSRIDDLQREEVNTLETEMRAIQMKLMALKINPGRTVTSASKQSITPIINPENPTEVYTLGKTPLWLVKLMADSGKTVTQLREEAKASTDEKA